MAFCPHCGERLGSQATKCLACGKDVHALKGGNAGRFKGTILMGAASPAPENRPAVAVTQGKSPSVAKATAIGGLSHPPTAPHTEGAEPKSAQAGPVQGKANFSATMLGGTAAPRDVLGRSPRPHPPTSDAPRGAPDPGQIVAPSGGSKWARRPAPANEPMDRAAVRDGGSVPYRGSPPMSGPPAAAPRDHAPRPHHLQDREPAPYAASKLTYADDSGAYSNVASMAATVDGQYTLPPGLVGSAEAGRTGEGRESGQMRPDGTASLRLNRLQQDPSRVSHPRHQDSSSGGLIWLLIGFVGMLAIAGLGMVAAKMMGLW